MRDCCRPPRGNLHCGADGVAIGFGSDQVEADAVIARPSLVVAIQISGTIVGGDQQIEVAIAIEVAVGQTASDFRLIETAAGFGGDIAESSLAIVEKQLRWLRVSDVAADVAHGLVDVAIGHGEIQPAVEVDVEKGAAESQAVSGGDPTPDWGAMSSKTLAAEPVEADHFVVEVGDGDAGRAGVVEIGDVDAHAGARLAFGAEGDSSLDGDFFECAVALVAVELVGLGVVGDEQIGPAIAVRHRARRRPAISSCCRRCRWWR